MHCLNGFRICCAIVAFLPYTWPMTRITNSSFTNAKKGFVIKSGTITYSTILEILRGDMKKIHTTLDKLTERFDQMDARFSHKMDEKKETENVINEKRYLSGKFSLKNEPNDPDTITNLTSHYNMDILRNKLDRLSRIQERNSRFLVIEMTSLTNLEESFNRLENMINSTRSNVDNAVKDVSSSSYRQQVIHWLTSIDKKLYKISSSNFVPEVPDLRSKIDCDNEQKNRSSIDDEVLEVENEGKTIKNLDSSNGTIRNCESLPKSGNFTSGVYSVDKTDIAMRMIWGNVTRINCDMTNDGGWTIIQRRGGSYGGRVNFTRSWNDYANGFGDLDGEFWLGNEVVHRMTFYHGHQYELRIELEDWNGEIVWAQYSNFELSTRMDGYRIKIAGYTGNATDSLSAHYSTPFSTYDRRNDFSPQCCPCATDYGGGWWYYSCFEANLNGDYYRMDEYREPYRGIIWEHWRDDYSLKSTKMMIRPRYNNSLNDTW